MTEQSRDLDWLIPVAAIVAVELLLWCASYSAGLAYRPMTLAYGTAAYGSLWIVLCWRLLMTIRGGKTLTEALSKIDRTRASAVIVGVFLIAVASAAFAALKAAMPKTVTFWLDPPLMEFERFLFGAHPWEITHAVLGWATPVIDRIYATFVPSHTIAVIIVVTARPSALKTQALICVSLAWLVLGVGGAYLLSSAGPIFYDRVFGGSELAALTEALRNAPITTKTADLLWHFHAADRPVIANGISAMPSMHVALTLWLALVVRGSKYAWVAWTYFALILLGSVHLGFHYLSDGLVSAAVMLLLWKVSPALVPTATRVEAIA